MTPDSIRQRIVEAYRSGLSGSYEKTAELFGVGRATVNRILRRHRETGDVKARPIGGNRKREVDLDWLREHAQAQPDARLRDRIAAWEMHSGRRVALATMCTAMREVGWTHKKKTPVAYEQEREDVAKKRVEFVENQPQLDARRLVFVDEAGFRLGSPPRHGWAPRGKDSFGREIHGKWETITMLGAMALDGFRGFMTIDSGTSTDVFDAFVTHELTPNLRPGDIVVMDNLSAHKNAAIRKKIEAVGCSVVFTPPYSPEFNPIEEAWAKLKDIVRRLETRTREAFDAAIAMALDQVSTNDIFGWVNYAGYRLSSK